MSEDYAQPLHRGSGGSTHTRKARATRGEVRGAPGETGGEHEVKVLYGEGFAIEIFATAHFRSFFDPIRSLGLSGGCDGLQRVERDRLLLAAHWHGAERPGCHAGREGEDDAIQ